jgi:hypothetical protein
MNLDIGAAHSSLSDTSSACQVGPHSRAGISSTELLSLHDFSSPIDKQKWSPNPTPRRTASPVVLSSPLVCMCYPTATERERAPLMSGTLVNVGTGTLS